MMRALGFALLLLLQLPLSAFSKIDREETTPVLFPEKPAAYGFSDRDVQNYIPLDMNPDEEKMIPMRLMDRSLQSFMESPHLRATIFGQTANTVQNKRKKDVTLLRNGSTKETKRVEHKFSFQLQALQTMAKLQYAGWLNAAIKYDAKASSSLVEFSDKVFNTNLFLNMRKSPDEQVGAVGLRWDW